VSGRRTRVRWQILIAGALLIVGLRLAPSLAPSLVLPVSLVWLGLLGYLLFTGYQILALRLRPLAAASIVVLLVMLPLAATALPVPTEYALRLPCPRNWSRLTSWLLRPSPVGSTLLTVNGATVRICYGRPASRGRAMLGGPSVPFGRLWRTGANEPTIIISPIGLTVAGIPMPPGRAALYTVPGPETWEIILNASTRQWGHESEYSDAVRAREIGRAILPSAPNNRQVERLTLSPDSAGVVLEWERIRVSIPIGPLSH
jgi:hypothetical protein